MASLFLGSRKYPSIYRFTSWWEAFSVGLYLEAGKASKSSIGIINTNYGIKTILDGDDWIYRNDYARRGRYFGLRRQ